MAERENEKLEEQKQRALHENMLRMDRWHTYSETVRICYEQLDYINDFGGSRQRSEGRRLLIRIIVRIREAQNRLWYEDV